MKSDIICPFCNHADCWPTRHGGTYGEEHGRKYWAVHCASCGAEGPHANSPGSATQAWNQAGGSYFDDVVTWHRRVGHPVRAHTRESTVDPGIKLAWNLIDEEYTELLLAVLDVSIVHTEVADGIADLVWVLCGLAARLGINMNAVWDEVRRSNFEKTGDDRRGDGKILKPEGWRPPDIAAALKVPITEK